MSINHPSNQTENDPDFFDDLKKRREAGEPMTEAEENYCLALESGYDEYVADLAYMQADDQRLSIGEEIYLEARFRGLSDEEAQELAGSANESFSGEFEKYTGNEALDWSETVDRFRERFFEEAGRKAYEEARQAGHDEDVAELLARRLEEETMSPGNQAYLKARLEGRDRDTAELIRRQADGEALDHAEAAYLEARLQGMMHEQAEMVAESVKNTVHQVRLRLRTTELN